MSHPLTRGLAAFISSLSYAHIPQTAASVARKGYTDCVGVLLAGANDSAPQILKAVLAPRGGAATLLFGADRAPGPDAAWINGTAAHAYDFDDVALKGHPSAVLVPAILAEAQEIGASGKEMITAYAAGYETWADLVRRDAEQHQRKGWHPTGIFGAVAAAAACASLRKLGPLQCATALALGASQAGGLIANFGTMTKPFHAGRAAHAGVLSARLAQSGYTASDDALEHAPGFLAAVSPGGSIDLDSPVEAGVDWKLATIGLDFKKYPLCFAVHTFLDGMLDLATQHGLHPEDVERVDTFIRRRHAIVLRYTLPRNALEAKFSMPFAIACALIMRRVGLTELDDAFVLRPDVQALMKRVFMTPDEREAVPPPPGILHDRVLVTLRDGRRLESGAILKARGTHDLPLSAGELWTKFESCAQAGGATVPPRALFDALISLDQIASVRDIPGLA
jgi:2-methylcitrate dehydratase PrpD